MGCAKGGGGGGGMRVWCGGGVCVCAVVFRETVPHISLSSRPPHHRASVCQRRSSLRGLEQKKGFARPAGGGETGGVPDPRPPLASVESRRLPPPVCVSLSPPAPPLAPISVAHPRRVAWARARVCEWQAQPARFKHTAPPRMPRRLVHIPLPLLPLLPHLVQRQFQHHLPLARVLKHARFHDFGGRAGVVAAAAAKAAAPAAAPAKRAAPAAAAGGGAAASSSAAEHSVVRCGSVETGRVPGRGRTELRESEKVVRNLFSFGSHLAALLWLSLFSRLRASHTRWAAPRSVQSSPPRR